MDTINIMITTSSIAVFDYTGSDTRNCAIIDHADISKYGVNKIKPPSRWHPEFGFDFDTIKFSQKYKPNSYYNVHNMVIYHYYHKLDYEMKVESFENKNQMIYIHDVRGEVLYRQQLRSKAQAMNSNAITTIITIITTTSLIIIVTTIRALYLTTGSCHK